MLCCVMHVEVRGNYFYLFFHVRPQLEGVVGGSGRAVLLHLASGHDPSYCLQFGHYYSEVKMLAKLCGRKRHTTF